jgi:hypothetical protein
MHPSLKIVDGTVSPDEEHVSLSYGSFDTDDPPFPPVARVSPPRKGVITLELLVDDSMTRGKKIIADVRRQVHWLFVEKGEANPWGYARYHCTTGANVYSHVHWGWVSNSSDTAT